jgi:CheY-like chemotaxis protein
MLAPTVLLDRVTVLVVDDEEPLRRYIGRVLDEAGFQAILTGNGHEALVLLERSRLPVQLVVSDVSMPQMSGPELATRIARRPHSRPVLFVSGGHTFGDLAAPLLTKPFLPGKLTEMVHRLLPGRFPPRNFDGSPRDRVPRPATLPPAEALARHAELF